MSPTGEGSARLGDTFDAQEDQIIVATAYLKRSTEFVAASRRALGDDDRAVTCASPSPRSFRSRASKSSTLQCGPPTSTHKRSMSAHGRRGGQGSRPQLTPARRGRPRSFHFFLSAPPACGSIPLSVRCDHLIVIGRRAHTIASSLHQRLEQAALGRPDHRFDRRGYTEPIADGTDTTPNRAARHPGSAGHELKREALSKQPENSDIVVGEVIGLPGRRHRMLPSHTWSRVLIRMERFIDAHSSMPHSSRRHCSAVSDHQLRGHDLMHRMLPSSHALEQEVDRSRSHVLS
jgi:hypothetical protein